MYLDKYNLKGRTAVVTGGGRGIGLACCQALAEAGAKVVIADVDPKVAAEGQSVLSKAGLAADVAQLDVTKSSEVTACADALNKKYGAVDILVANAGIARSGTGGAEVSDEHWLSVIDVNLNGVFWCNRAFGRHMLGRRRGAIVNIGSMSAIIVNKPQKQAYYNRLEGGRASSHQVPGGRVGRARRARQRGGAHLHRGPHPLRHGGQDDVSDVAGEHADEARRSAGRDRLGRAVPRLRRRQPDDRQHRCGRRRLYLLVGALPASSNHRPSP
jgi:hypothetical protein